MFIKLLFFFFNFHINHELPSKKLWIKLPYIYSKMCVIVCVQPESLNKETSASFITIPAHQLSDEATANPPARPKTAWTAVPFRQRGRKCLSAAAVDLAVSDNGSEDCELQSGKCSDLIWTPWPCPSRQTWSRPSRIVPLSRLICASWASPSGSHSCITKTSQQSSSSPHPFPALLIPLPSCQSG